jgi:putative phosphoribosyl transferase
MNTKRETAAHTQSVDIACEGVSLRGDLVVPDAATGLVAFAHGSGSSRLSPRNRYVAGVLQDGGLATLLFDLLTPQEEEIDLRTRHLRFDIPLLAERLVAATDWLRDQDVGELPLGYFGASTGAAAALIAAAERAERVGAVVSRGGRPDLAIPALPRVEAATLLIVGGLDHAVIEMNREALRHLSAPKKLEIVEGATHLFEERDTLAQVASLARDWFVTHLSPATAHV